MASYVNLNTSEFEEMIRENSDIIILDVRTSIEFREGHLPGAINMSNVKEGIKHLDPSKTYLLHCRVGGRSAVASQLLVNAGFEKVFNLNGSIEHMAIPLQKAG